MPQQVGLKIALIIDSLAPPDKSEITLYTKYPPGVQNERKKWEKELEFLRLKYYFMKIDVDKRVPVNSNIDFHKWFLTKDKFGIFYIMLIQEDIFEEKFVFKLQRKLSQHIEYYEHHIGNFEKMQEHGEELQNIVEDYNNAISQNAAANFLITPSVHEEVITNKSHSLPIVNIPSNKSDFKYEDPHLTFNMVKDRNSRLQKLQLIVILCVLIAVVLAAVQIKMFFKGSK